MDTIMKKINNILVILIILIDMICLVFYTVNYNLIKILTCLSLILVILIPNILPKKIKINENIRLIYILYVFSLLLIGSIINLYNKFYYYDSITHFITGFITSLFSLIILNKFNKYNKNSVVFNAIFMISITLSIASLWEIFEFINSKIFMVDVQRVLSTGVNDTMKDIILALLGSILFNIWYIYKSNTNDIDKFLT